MIVPTATTYLAPDMGGVLSSGSFVNQASTAANNDPNAVYYTISDPFNTGLVAGTAKAITSINKPVGRAWGNNFVSNFQSTYANQTIKGPVPTNSLSYMEQWNLAVGQQFKGQQSIEVGYAGALDVHLLPSGGTASLDQPSATQVASIQTCTGSCNQRQYTPYPNFRNVTNQTPYVATVNYNSMQIRYEKRFGAAGMITSGYTWSKSIGNSDTTMNFLDNQNDGAIQDYNNLKNERSLLSWSFASRWVTSYVLNVPIGKGQKFLSSTNGVVDRIIGGWAVNGITLLQSGQPLLIRDGSNAMGNWNMGTLRPTVVAGCDKKLPGSQQARLTKWFNTSCYTSNAGSSNWTLGNQPRVDSTLRASGQANWDFSLLKSTRITENSSLQFRMEFYNIFNRRQWAMPNMNASTGAGFGQVTGGQQNFPRQIQASLRLSF